MVFLNWLMQYQAMSMIEEESILVMNKKLISYFMKNMQKTIRHFLIISFFIQHIQSKRNRIPLDQHMDV